MTRNPAGRSLYFVGVLIAMVFLPVAGAVALEEGEITGNIERVNEGFARDYNTLDYKGQKEWDVWGKDLKALGWVVLQGDSGELKDYLLLVIDSRTKIEKEDGTPGGFSDFGKGTRIRASYKMGWDALHALHVKILTAGSNE